MKLFKKILESKFFQKKRNRVITICVAVALIIAIVWVVFFTSILERIFAPSITLMSPAPVLVFDRGEIVVDVVMSDLPERVFPAASLSAKFDKNKLELVSVKQGTMMTLNNYSEDETTYNIPIWKSDIEAANRLGKVNTMYLDMTGGQFAYVKEGFAKEEKDILLRLVFCLRDSAKAGEVYNITVEDAVLATVGGDYDNTSLATSNRTLKAYPAKIVVKEGM